MTEIEAGKIIAYLQCAGLEPKAAQVANPTMTRRVYADAFNHDGLSFDEAMAGAMAFVRSGVPFFPTPGQLLALSPPGLMAARFGADLDVDAAWSDFRARLRTVGSYHTVEAVTDAMRDPDRMRDAAMVHAWRTTGARGWFLVETKEMPYAERRWKDAYRAFRREQGTDPQVVRMAITVATRRAFAAVVPEAK